MARSAPQLARSDLDAASPRVLRLQYDSLLALAAGADELPEQVSMPATLLLAPGLAGARREALCLQARMLDGAVSLTEIDAAVLDGTDVRGPSPETTIGDIVVVAVDEVDVDEARVQALIDACAPPADLTRVVVLVSERPSRWQGLRGVMAHVHADAGQVARTACNVFCALSTHGASRMLTCLDLADLITLFEGAGAPFRLLSASWRIDEARLHWHDAHAEARFRASRAIVEAIYLHSGSMRANRYAELVQTLHGLQRQGDDVLMLDAPVYGFLAAEDDPGVVPIHLLVLDEVGG